MKVGDHNPSRNLSVLRALVDECNKQELEWLKVSDLAEVITNAERQFADPAGDRSQPRRG